MNEMNDGDFDETEEVVEEEIENEDEQIEKINENENDVKESNEELVKKAEEYDVLYDKYLRINAEYENFRRRTAKEKESIYSEAVIDVLITILPVIDNVERALQFSENAGPEKVSEGIKMIYSQFLNSLAKLGVEEIKSAGELFNPEVHNAVFHEEDENQPDNTVTEALQKGYIKGDKVIRPAMVKVVN